MASGVSNSNNRQGLYIAGGTLLGAGAGIGTAILSKPYLEKDGSMTTDFFVKARDAVPQDYLKAHADAPELKKFQELFNELKAVDSKEALEKFLSKAKIEEAQLVTKSVDAFGLNEAKNITGRLIEIDKLSAAEDLAWEKETANLGDLTCNFKENYKKLSKETQASVKKAMKEITTKKALIFGGLGAAIALFITSLAALLKNKKSEKS